MPAGCSASRRRALPGTGAPDTRGQPFPTLHAALQAVNQTDPVGRSTKPAAGESLDRSGKVTGRGATWTRTNVCGLRNTIGIPIYREGKRTERGEVTLDEAADILKVSRATAYRMVSRGALAARQLCARAPWIIRLADMRRDAEARRSRHPSSQNPLQNSLVL
jgi:hypothetical protein